MPWYAWYAWLALIAVAAIGIVIIVKLWRHELREAASFCERPRQNVESFLSELDLLPGSHEADIALKMRQLIADLALVPPETIHASTRFYPDLEKLPFYNSLDTVEELVEIEKIFEVRVPNATALELMELMKQGCVRDFVLVWVQYVQMADNVRSA